MRLLYVLLACWPDLLWADPLDQGEAYAARQGPPVWMDNVDLSLLLVDYGIFALLVVALGWAVVKYPQRFVTFETIMLKPILAIFLLAKRVGGVGEILLQMIGGLAGFILAAAWVFFCQWLKSIGLGAFSMAGLALLALMLVRMIRGKEREHPLV